MTSHDDRCTNERLDGVPGLRRAVVLFLPPPVQSLVDDIRTRWDPVMTARIGAHVTLIHDVVDHSQAAQLVADAAAAAQPFPIRLVRAGRWGKSAYGIYLDVEDPTGGIAALHDRLRALEHPAWARVPFRAHATLVHGRTVDAAAANRAWVELAGFDPGWDVDVAAIDVIELAEPLWRTVARHELGLGTVG